MIEGLDEVISALRRLKGKDNEIGTADASGWDTSVTRSLWVGPRWIPQRAAW